MDLSQIIYDIFKNNKDGIFVEFGANDGIQQSNTFLLEKNNNWSGLLIEPSPNLFFNLQTNRPNSKIESCAVSDRIGTIRGDFTGHLMSSVDGKRLNNNNLIEVPCFTLNYLCEKHGIKEMDLCSIDVEGYEKNILKSIDFSILKIKNFVIEIYKWDEDEILNFLEQNGYQGKCLSNFNKIDHPYWDGSHQDYFFSIDI
jgi:FkbM family methyltransferase